MSDHHIDLDDERVSRLVDCVRRQFGEKLRNIQLSREFYYKHLPLCVIDAVWSLGVRYGAVQKVVARWCEYAGWTRYRAEAGRERSMSEFLAKTKDYTPEDLAEKVFRNCQRTSARSGILKADAVVRWAKVLQEHQYETFADFHERGIEKFPEEELKAIPGQGSGKSIAYFYMLAGHEEFVKPDRMLTGYVESAIGQTGLSANTVADLVRRAAHHLRSEGYDELTPRKLDYLIWQEMSASGGNRAGRRHPTCH